MSTKCKFCKKNEAYGQITENGMLHFGFGSKYDFDTYNINTADLTIKVTKAFYKKSNICDDCFGSIFKEDSSLIFSIYTTIGDDTFWVIDACNLFPDKYSVSYDDNNYDILYINTEFMGDNVTLPVIPHYMLNTPFISAKNIESFLLALHPNSTNDPMFILVSKKDSELYTKYNSIWEGQLNNSDITYDSALFPITIKFDDDMFPLTYLWMDIEGELINQCPYPERTLYFNDAVCIYKNSLCKLIIDGDVYTLEDLDGNVIPVDDKRAIRCSFNK